MKEKYISPELELLCLAPREALASGLFGGELDFGAVKDAINEGLELPENSGVSKFDPDDDIEVTIPGL